MPRLKRIIAACKETASGEIIGIIAPILKERGHCVKVLVYGPADRSFRRVSKSEPDVVLKDTHLAAIAQIADFLPDVIVTGTGFPEKSNPYSLEQTIVAAANAFEIPSVAIVDTWASFDKRFSRCNPDNLEIVEPNVFVPKAMCLLDEILLAQAKALGFDPSILYITGNPMHSEILKAYKLRTKKDAEAKTEICRKFSWDEKRPIVLALPDMLSSYYPEKMLGYDEHDFIKILFSVLFEISRKMPLNVLVRPHPADKDFDVSSVSGFITPKLGAGVDLVPHVTCTSALEDSISAAKLVVGMFTNVFVAARIYKKPAISFQPNLKGEDKQAATNRGGITHLSTSQFTLKYLVSCALFGSLMQKSISVIENSAQKIIEVIESMA